MKRSGTVAGVLVLFIVARPGISGAAGQDSASQPERRSVAWDDTTAVRLLNQGAGQMTPDGAGGTVDVEHPDFARALRVSSTSSGSENKWREQFRLLTKEPIARGDVLVIALTLRGVQCQGRVFIAFGTAQPPHANALSRWVDLSPQWQEFQFPIVATQDYAPGAAKIAVGFGGAVQTVDVGRVEVFNFKDAHRVWDFVNSSSYRGIEADAPWRKAAWERIERIRKADVRIEVVEADGKPVPEAAVKVRMTAHAFRFGSSFNPHVYRQGKAHPDLVSTYEKRFLDYFNVATPEAVMSWNSWHDPELRACLVRAVDFLAAHNIPVIGHPLVWQEPRILPDSLQKLVREKDYTAYVAQWNSHLAEKVDAMRGRLCEHLVINEFVDNNFLPESMTDEAILGWYRLVRQHDPAARLGILEHKMISDGAIDAEDRLRWFESMIEMLLNHGIPLDLIAFQGHFRDQLTEPELLLEIFDRFARYKLPLQVTEFDVEMDDEQLQAEYLRDFFIACFSHPSVELLQQWGFWEPSHWRPRASLFRTDWSAKPNGRQFLDLVFDRWMTRETGNTDASGQLSVRGFLGDYEVTAEKDGCRSNGRFALSQGGCSVRLVLESGSHVSREKPTGSIRLGDRIEATAVALAPGAGPREQLAAKELVDYLARMSGKRLERIEIGDGKVPGGVIAVGRLAKDAGVVSQEELDAVARDGYVLKVADGRGAVCGWRDLGTLCGAYGLLRHLGVKFYAEECVVVPQVGSVTIPEGATHTKSPFEVRTIYALYRLCGFEPSVKLGYTPNDDQGNFVGPDDKEPSTHTAAFLVPYKTYGKSHPEYFALQKDGQRLHPVPGKRFDIHLCLSNPDVRRISGERMIDLIDSQKERAFFVITQGDGYDWCLCDACKALDATAGDHMTDRLLDYVNDVARAVAQRYPDKILLTAAYTDATSRPPVRVRPEPNVRIGYCPYPGQCNCQSHDLTCEKNRQSAEDIRGWLEKCPGQVYVNEYPRGYHCWYEPFGSFYSMARRVKQYTAGGVTGIAFCAVPENFRDLFIFVIGRLSWEPDADVEALIDEFMAAYYGKAAPAVREYFDFMHQEIDGRPVHQMCERANPQLVTAAFADKALGIFARAQAAVDDDPVRLARVDAEKFCVLWADVHQRNPAHGRLAVDEAEFDRRLGDLVRIARDQMLLRVGRTDLGLTQNWLSYVAGIKLAAEPWYSDPMVEQLIRGRQ